jgi:hypothetical protein
MVQEVRGYRVQDVYQDEVQAWVQDEVQAWVQGRVQDRWGLMGSGKGSGEVQGEVSTGSGTRGGHEVQGRVQGQGSGRVGLHCVHQFYQKLQIVLLFPCFSNDNNTLIYNRTPEQTPARVEDSKQI